MAGKFKGTDGIMNAIKNRSQTGAQKSKSGVNLLDIVNKLKEKRMASRGNSGDNASAKGKMMRAKARMSQ